MAKGQILSTSEPESWADTLVGLYKKLKPYKKVRSVITVRNDSSSTLQLEAAYVLKGEFDKDPSLGESLAPGNAWLFPVKTSAGMPGYEFYALWRVHEPEDGDSYSVLTACRWSQPKSFKAVAPPDVRVGLTTLDGFNAFVKKKAFNSLKHEDIASGTGSTHFGRVRQIVKESKSTNKNREGVYVTGITAVNTEFYIADVPTGMSKQRKKPKLKVGKARRKGKTIPF